MKILEEGKGWRCWEGDLGWIWGEAWPDSDWSYERMSKEERRKAWEKAIEHEPDN